MSQSTLTETDDSLVKAADRIVRQFNVQAAEVSSTTSLEKGQGRSFGGLESVWQRVDDLAVTVDHLAQLFSVRSNVNNAVIERLEKNFSLLSGRIDALSEDLARATSLSAINNQFNADEENDITKTMVSELAPLIELTRSLFEDAVNERAKFMEDIRNLTASINPNRSARKK